MAPLGAPVAVGLWVGGPPAYVALSVVGLVALLLVGRSLRNALSSRTNEGAADGSGSYTRKTDA